MHTTHAFSNSQARWQVIQGSDNLKDGISSYEQYYDAAVEGLARVTDTLSHAESVSYSLAQFSELHHMAFGGVDRNAGQYRTRQVQFGPFNGADSSRIDRELQLLQMQHQHLMAEASTPEEKLCAAAFAHARAIRIHPFGDGNGRLARAILAEEVAREFQIEPDLFMEALAERRESYRQGIRATAGEPTLKENTIPDEKRGFLRSFLALFRDQEAPLPDAQIDRERVDNVGPLMTVIGDAIHEAYGPKLEVGSVASPDGGVYTPFKVGPQYSAEYALPSLHDDWGASLRAGYLINLPSTAWQEPSQSPSLDLDV